MNKILVILFSVAMIALGGCSKDEAPYPHPNVQNVRIQNVDYFGSLSAFCSGFGTLTLRLSGKQDMYTDGYQKTTVEWDFETDPSSNSVRDVGTKRYEPCSAFTADFVEYDSNNAAYSDNSARMNDHCEIKMPKAVRPGAGSITKMVRVRIAHARMIPAYEDSRAWIQCP